MLVADECPVESLSARRDRVAAAWPEAYSLALAWSVIGSFRPNIDGPLIGGTDLFAGPFAARGGALADMAGRIISGVFAVACPCETDPCPCPCEFEMSAPTGFRASSKLPHIPQKRKVFALSSPHFGQITIVSPNLYSKFKLAPRFSQASSTLFCSY
jgi:hypothetical protein